MKMERSGKEKRMKMKKGNELKWKRMKRKKGNE